MAQLAHHTQFTGRRALQIGLLRTAGFVAFLCAASVLLDRLA